MKAGWKTNTLENCLERFRVPAKIQRKQFRETGAFPIVSQEADFVNGYWNEAGDVCVLDRPVVIFGDHTQVLKYVDFDFVVGADGVKVLAPKPFIDAKYLYYFVMANRAPSLGYARHYRHVKELAINYPALEEQQRIVAVLDEAFEGLARARVHAEANLQNARALIEAGLGTAFNPVTAKLNGWDLSDLSSMAKLSYGYTTKANSEPNGPKFLRITDIQDGTVDWDNVPFCSTPPDDYERYRVKSGDILFARTGATTGKSYLMTDEIEAVAASYLIRLRLASMALKPEYLALFFQSDVYWETIRAGISGSTQGGFNASKLGELVVPVPPLAIQDVVISRLEEIQDQAARLTSTYFVKLQDLDDLRQSLLQKAFAGELT